MTLYQAQWEATTLPAPVLPQAASDPLPTVAASPNTAYALLAPGWEPSSNPPTSLMVLESLGAYELHLNQTLDLAVNDALFAGNCATGSFLSQAEADFLTQRVFASAFSGLVYDAATCTVTSAPDGGP